VNDYSRDKEARLLELLDKELEIFKQIHGLTEKQAELLAADDVDAFGESLDSRQDLIEKINGLHQESDILMQSYVSFSKGVGNKKSRAIETAIEEISRLIAECFGLNDKNTTIAKLMADDYIQRIGKLSLGRKSLGVYAQGVPNDPELFDRKT